MRRFENFRVDKTGIEFYAGWVTLERDDIVNFLKALQEYKKIKKLSKK